MKQDVLTQFPMPWLTVVGLLIFFGFFVALLINVSRKTQKSVFAVASQLPLEDAPTYEAKNE